MNYIEKAIKRIVEQFQELPEDSRSVVLDRIKYDSLIQAATELSKTRTVYFGDLYADVVERQKYFNVAEGMMTGLKYFDDATMGLRAGELIIIAGPSNYGKTMVSLNVITSAIVRSHAKVLVVSMEMPALEIASRTYNMTSNHEALMEKLIIQTELSVSTKHIAAMIERHKPDIIMVDHIQFLANQEQGKEFERVSAAVAKLKRLAIEYNLPIIAISHVAKTRSGSQGQATAMDLKGSSSIEQDCDIGFMINRYADSKDGDDIVLTLFKHRTKRPPVFLKDCVLSFNGVRIANAGDYYTDDPDNPTMQLKHKIQRVWNT